MAETIPLNPITLPLNQISLIEASAGTGKTYTIGSLYLRLLLKAGENNFSRPLNVEEILVVTFTEMATEELKKKIRERITDAINKLTAFAKTQDKSAFKNDEFLTALCHDLDIFEAIHRLKLAEQNMDLAAIYTIHGFCRRMLMQYAFHSGIHFNLELIKDQSDLLVRFANEFWREHFYPLPFEMADFIANELGSPDYVLSLLESNLGKNLIVDLENQQALSISITEFLQQYLGEYFKDIKALKLFWLESAGKISELITEELNKDYAKGEPKSLSRRSYNTSRLAKWIEQVNAWANNPRDYLLNKTLMSYFTQSALGEKCEEGASPFIAPIFTELEERANALISPDLLRRIILYHYCQSLQQKLLDYKLNHQEKSFDDLLRLLCEALQDAQGDELAEMIRFQYPFAMIDEFQDTDSQQYAIFSKIYRDNPEKNTGFIMIGDPKQAIYRFRGADIFTYLKASDEAQSRFELTKNYRSEKHLVDGVNALFDFPQSPFIYQNIKFTAVDSRDDHLRFYLNGKAEPAYRFYLTESDKVNKTEMAKICAVSIQYWLKSAVENQAVFQNEDTYKTLQAANIAVLVRDKNEAALVKNELQKLGIASVYLSDQNSVFDSNVAKELAWVLKACLNVAERPILNAIATALFGLNAADIHQIQQNEADWQRWADSFAQYQQTWQRQGILVMLHQILLEQGISERLLSQATGERDLTDFLHLAEILQQAATLHESEAALLSWFEKQIQGEGRQEAQIRLESERQLVKIVSIHKSKGLEYDLVWLPFLAVPSKIPTAGDMNVYYSKERDETLWDIENRNLNALCEETFAEELRLLYVALTRAKYQMAFALPAQFDKKWNALHYVLSQGEIGKEIALSAPKDTETLLQTFKEKMRDNVEICTKPNLEDFPALSINTKNDELKAAEFTGNIEQDWRITSFTSIEQGHRRQNYFTESAGKKHAVFDDAKDYDSQNSIEISTALLNESESSILDLPRGKQVGTALHRHFENCYFSDLANTEEIDKLRQSLQLDETFAEPLQNWLQQISHTSLSNEIGIALADLANKDCIKEMPFYLAIREHFDVEAFNRALKAHHHLPSKPLQFEQIQGMVRGSIDLVFRHNGKYYLVDYKSNFLGSTLADYNQEALKKEMLHSHYDWQYLIYTLALHRYLQSVVSHYDYARDFGGVFYLFLRGMNGEPQPGVFYDRPSVELITELDGVF
ncbi:exodeoxyribonuclease V subunit beta [Haemophilus influenzae]|uniref:RecBCD enzyme subunit RecB n=1 Tax=Haemophilus influenzae (strain NTHi 3655) TaxID=375177 RepID=A0AAJ8WTJ2_HAEI3|nr:exodeoxyribonuclease V subunit beta [Haemophilus influenzae]KOR02069.1 exodeoxyribonuclease V subunit beta [Haemophilus influenzae]MCC3181725.1 exodeoxyribonuclease V subunit beta [Haemophilus influenzae]MCK8841655.1 exodeoxyribonuclease V subunit beta [Haemophilus influenzae]MCK8918762.1 exodeoxyribonuclease V subunit beta [Haemophilus influenzae]MCK8920342.1 exodeoxyribonuclease V subunit beta [Haemophilus influenzae]